MPRSSAMTYSKTGCVVGLKSRMVTGRVLPQPGLPPPAAVAVPCECVPLVTKSVPPVPWLWPPWPDAPPPPPWPPKPVSPTLPLHPHPDAQSAIDARMAADEATRHARLGPCRSAFEITIAKPRFGALHAPGARREKVLPGEL